MNSGKKGSCGIKAGDIFFDSLIQIRSVTLVKSILEKKGVMQKHGGDITIMEQTAISSTFSVFS